MVNGTCLSERLDRLIAYSKRSTQMPWLPQWLGSRREVCEIDCGPMSKLMTLLAEANIRDWQRRLEAGEATITPSDSAPLEGEGLEAQLFKEILSLRQAAAAADDAAERERLRRRGADLYIQLMAVVEKDRPLLARTLAERLDE